MIIGLSNWGVDVDVTPCLAKGFRIRGICDSGDHRGKFFSSLEIKSFNEDGVMQCIDGCQYQTIDGPSLGRNSARIEHWGALNQIVTGSHNNFHAFLTALTAWTKSIQPLPRLQEVTTRTAFLAQKRGTSLLAQLWEGKNILQCTTTPPRQTAAQKNQASALAQRATSPITTQGDASSDGRVLAGINEHCATSLLSLSFFRFTGSSSIPGKTRHC
jgi:hypothetical protein